MGYAASVARQRVATKGPGEDGWGGIAFRPGVEGQSPSVDEALQEIVLREVCGLFPSVHSGVWRFHLGTMAEDIDR